MNLHTAPKKVLTALAFLTLTTAVSAETLNESFSVAKGGKLDIHTDIGSFDIETHSKDTVLVEIVTKGIDEDEFEIVTSQNGDDVSIIGELERRNGWKRRMNVKFTVTVPEEYNLELKTNGGSISIDNLTGNIDANTSGGSIFVGKVNGDVDLHTSGGSITTDEVKGGINAHTSGGSIEVVFAEQLVDDATLTTSGGSITAYLIEGIEIDLDASTSGGRVRSDFDVNGRTSKKSIRGEINGGGPRLKLRTSGGSVRIKER